MTLKVLHTQEQKLPLQLRDWTVKHKSNEVGPVQVTCIIWQASEYLPWMLEHKRAQHLLVQEGKREQSLQVAWIPKTGKNVK